VPRASPKGARRALVLGCGGVAGAAWMIATLAELQRALAWDARDADVLVGTSAGALVAALLAAGVSVDRMVRSQRGELTDDCWNHDVDWGPALPPLPAPRLTAPGLVLRSLHKDVGVMTALTGLMPRGRADLGSFRRLIDNVVPSGGWARHPATWIMVVDTRTGERVALGRPGSPPVPLREAVCASYAVPGWCPPVTWQGATYIDGGVASPTSADLLSGTNIDEAVVLAPMASRDVSASGERGSTAARALRRHMTAIVDREVRTLEQAGIRVIRLEPCADDRAAFGGNLMAPERRRRVFETAVRTAKDAVADAVLA
jgi:NTE family protein